MFDFRNSISGKTYYLRILASLAFVILVIFLATSLGTKSTLGTIMYIVASFLVITWLVFLISQIRQRANDIGWHPLLLTFLAFVINPGWLILGLIPGKKQP
jgi:hypothetical protein